MSEKATFHISSLKSLDIKKCAPAWFWCCWFVANVLGCFLFLFCWYPPILLSDKEFSSMGRVASGEERIWLSPRLSISHWSEEHFTCFSTLIPTSIHTSLSCRCPIVFYLCCNWYVLWKVQIFKHYFLISCFKIFQLSLFWFLILNIIFFLPFSLKHSFYWFAQSMKLTISWRKLRFLLL